jgi:hypothetical protein
MLSGADAFTRATTTSGVKVAQHSKGLKMGLTLTMAPGGGA